MIVVTRERTAGRQALLVVIQTTTQATIASRIGVAQSRVSEWLSGRTRPGGKARRALFDAYGIEPDAWGVCPRNWRG